MRTLLAILLLCSRCAAKELVTPDRLELIGGYRVPRFSGHEKAVRTTGFPRGGMAIHTQPDGTVLAFVENGEQGTQVLECTGSGPPGAGADPQTWPLLSQGSVWNRSELFPGLGVKGYEIPEGLAFDGAAQRLYVSTRSTYATPPLPKLKLAAVQYPAKTILAPQVFDVTAQRYGGGLTITPTGLAFASGGFTGGQGGGNGPSFARINADGSLQEVMHFAATDQVGADQPNGYANVKPRVERAFADYSVGKCPWAIPPDETGGYFATSSLRGGGTYVDTPTVHGVCYFVRQPIGLVTYSQQNECLATQYATNLYVYDPADLDGSKAASEPRAKFYRWQLPFFNKPARACCFNGGILWVYYPQVWTQAGVSGRYPVIAAYRIKEVEPPRITKKLRVISGEWKPGEVVEVEEVE